MKNSIFTFAILLSIFSLTLSSCSSDDVIPFIEDPIVTESSYTLTLNGVIATEVVGEVMACPDGYFSIAGKTPNGDVLTIDTGKILVNETRSVCDLINNNTDDWLACVNAGGYNVGVFMIDNYLPMSGTATRTSTNSISITGVLMNANDLTEHAFTVEATAGLMSPVNCE